MAEIVSLKEKREKERLIWTCSCGCQSFSIFSDETLKCAHCGNESMNDPYCWKKLPLVQDIDRLEEVKNGGLTSAKVSNDFISTRITQVFNPDDDILFIIKKNGRVHTYGDPIREHEQKEWLLRRLRDVFNLLTGKRVI